MESSAPFTSKAVIGTVGIAGAFLAAALGGMLQAHPITLPRHASHRSANTSLKPWRPPATLEGELTWLTKCDISYTDEEQMDILGQAYLVRQAANVMCTRYLHISNLLQADATELAVMLPALTELEQPFRQFQLSVEAASRNLSCLQAAANKQEVVEESDELLQELSALSTKVRSSFLQSLLAARQSDSLAKITTKSATRETFADFEALKSPDPVEQLETFAVQIISAHGGSTALFDLGMYVSESTILKKDVSGISEAEHWLLKGEQNASDQQRSMFALARAERLDAHAELLASFGNYDIDAAAARYKSAAKIAVKQEDPQRAAIYLSRLTLFLASVGRDEESLSAADHTLAFDPHDPVAAYIQVDFRRKLGLLRTPSQILSAEAKLARIAGMLDTHPDLEASRMELLEQFQSWRAAADVSSGRLVERFLDATRKCLLLGDAAQILLCLLCKLVFPS